MANVSGTVKPSIAFQYTPAGWLAGQPLSIAPPSSPNVTLANGTGAAGLADTVYEATLTLSAAPTTLDLTSLLDPLGNSIAFARVRYFYIRNNATTAGQVVTIGGAGTNEWSGSAQFLSAGATLRLGTSTTGSGSAAVSAGTIQASAPDTNAYVVDSTHKLLKLDPGANTLTVEILIVGAST